ncbi:MAG: efflux RND transporter periplasmic adaptor subunit [Vicinamibacterales bacterium]
MKKLCRAALAASLILTLAVAGCGGEDGVSQILYHCPMHPDYVSDKPGDCPICGMRLVPLEKRGPSEGNAARPGEAPAGATTTTGRRNSGSQAADLYTCPMHPEVRSDRPGKCPICGMDLERVTKPGPRGESQPSKESDEPPAADESQHRPPASGQSAAAGHEGHQGGGQTGPVRRTEAGTVISMTADQVRLAGVRTIAAARGRVAKEIRAVGTVEADETRVRQVTTKVAGFVEKLYTAAVGQHVAAGEPMFDLYSPELLASQEEYLRARKTSERFSRSALPEVRQGGADLAATARRRLELFDVPREFLERLEQTGAAERLVTFRAPFGGYVTQKNVLQGQRIEPGMPLVTLSDLSRVWVTAQVYEAEAAAARVGQPARVTLPHDPSVSLSGRVSFVYPTLDVESRTLKVRLEFANPRLMLKPGMFVNVDLSSGGDTGVVVPDSAILDTGTRSLVFVERTPGEFEARQVETGPRAEGLAVVRRGLAEGERVAVAANFLLDSESRLRNAIGIATSGREKR